MRLTWHGHSTWSIELDGTTVLIDPFFDNPKTGSDPTDLSPDYVLVTHGHADHIADVGAYADSATVVGTPEVTEYLADEFGVRETIGMNIGGTVECDDAYVSMVQAVHTNGLETGYEFEAGQAAGYVVSDTVPTQLADEESRTFYHSGDTALFSEMREVIRPYLEPDAVALPVGDHFTMGPRQAAIAVDWLDPDYAFPMHYDTFPPIEVRVEDFRREVRAVGQDASVEILEGDQSFDLTAALHG